ncbi:MAG: hypothetical protein RL477_1248 [Pseudomonadota bacterium]|jgi:hypothetical protein
MFTTFLHDRAVPIFAAIFAAIVIAVAVFASR